VGRLIYNFKVGDLVIHKILKEDGFEVGIVVGYDWDNTCIYVFWIGGKKVYHIPEMLKHLSKTI
jgi:hypothetical protein